MNDITFDKLLQFLRKIPSIENSISSGIEDRLWWVKFKIDINHKLAWRVVQEIGYVLNYVSVNERLPTTFKPVSPPPCLNGGPKEFLSWVIESESENFTSDNVAEWLEGHLPNPVNNIKQWKMK